MAWAELVERFSRKCSKPPNECVSPNHPAKPHTNSNNYTTKYAILCHQFRLSCSILIVKHGIIANPHLLVRATSERFPPARATFRSVLANKSQQLQPLLVLTVRWWPGTSKYGWAIRDGRGVGLFKNGSTLLTSKTGFAYENPKVFSFLPIHHHHHAAIACNYLSIPTGNLIHSSMY